MPVKWTEEASPYRHLEKWSVERLVHAIHFEDQRILAAVEPALPVITDLVEKMIPRILQGGRIFYVGAGTSGRLGVLDAAEAPPTYGVSEDLVNGIIAGGDIALKSSVEGAEDNMEQGSSDLDAFQPDSFDICIGISASGSTPYVIGALQNAKKIGLLTASIVCNPDSKCKPYSEFLIELMTGPEFITGSTRMKAGTATKMVLNMISTACMIGIGRVEDNKMVHMKLVNNKLRERAIKIIQLQFPLDSKVILNLLEKHGSVKKVLDRLKNPE